MNDAWLTMNQRHLARAVADVRRMLEHYVTPGSTAPAPLPAAGADDGLPPAALDVLCASFRLTAFERAVVLLCAGVELEHGFALLCGRARGNPGLRDPTFGLALAALPEAHWTALAPDAPLRRWRLIVLAGRGEPITTTPLRISERVLHFLTGINSLDEHLDAILQPVEPAGELPPSQTAVALEIAQSISRADRRELPVVQLCGRADGDKRAIAAAAATRLGVGLRALAAAELPVGAVERVQLVRLWEREATLGNWALLVEADSTDGPEVARALTGFLETVQGVVMVAVREPLKALIRPALIVDVRRPRAIEQRVLWQQALGARATQLNGALDQVLSHFDLSARHVRSASAQALLRDPDEAPLGAAVWDACRTGTRPRLEGLAQRIDSAAQWDDLVLPAAQLQVLHEIAGQLRCRHQVYQTWGFAAHGSRGLGITALFAGGSGTGKTFAAEVLAAELRLDLFRIDLSQVVSKYIGETEKNLRRVFEAAEGSGAILLFDEADALFGKRSEVKDSHDRFANIEISYLLQQMEAYRGLAILTTNLRQALDPAFLRRIRFVVSFPFPGPAERAEIWSRIFPAATPTEALDVAHLARLNVAGGSIRNIALNAAFRAADDGAPIRMAHLLQAARSEYEKLEKPLTQSETEGWT